MANETQNFENKLFNIARGYASYATRLAKGYAPNRHLRDSIHSTVDAKGRGVYIIRTQAKGPDARAREYGSGIHARRRGPHYITIRPKNKKVLAFFWEKANENIPRLPDGRVMLKSVEHPGVEAAQNGKGYIGPAFNETRKALRERLLKEGAEAIRIDLRASFRVKR